MGLISAMFALILLQCTSIKSFRLNVKRMAALSQPSTFPREFKLKDTESNSLSVDLKGYTLSCRFDGLGTRNMTALLTLGDANQVYFSGGILSASPGFWRLTNVESVDCIECTMPVLPLYLAFFDISEDTLLWRGKLDMANKKVFEGEILTSKKRWGIFPYTETMGTFTADLFSPNEKVPVIELPVFPNDELPRAPADFETPYDMKRYPEYFDPEFVEWWFASEEAMAKGEEPPLRPKPFFIPKALKPPPPSQVDDNPRQRTKSPKSTSGTAFGKKK